MSVTALEIQRREPVLGGRAGGAAGAYEKIVGVLRFAVDPTLPIHAEMMGSTLPFAPSAEERGRRGDPRLSIAERYASREDYLAMVRAAAEALVAVRHMLAEDIDAVVARASRQWDLFEKGL